MFAIHKKKKAIFGKEVTMERLEIPARIVKKIKRLVIGIKRINKMKTQEIKECGTVNIEYEFFFSDFEVIVESDYEHIQTSIRKGYVEGELVHEGGRGYWKIKE